MCWPGRSARAAAPAPLGGRALAGTRERGDLPPDRSRAWEGGFWGAGSSLEPCAGCSAFGGAGPGGSELCPPSPGAGTRTPCAFGVAGAGFGHTACFSCSWVNPASLPKDKHLEKGPQKGDFPQFRGRAVSVS